jgi:hypothetical protein
MSVSESSHVEHLVGLGHGGCGGCEGGVSSSSDTALDYGYVEVFLDSACRWLRIVVFLNLYTCNHLLSILLDVLKLAGALVLEAVGPRVDI